MNNVFKASHDLKKFIALSFIMFLTLYILNILKNSKDTLIVITLGAELISTIKLYAVLPAAVILTLIYIKLTNILTRLQIYHLLNVTFISFFVLFDRWLYPNLDRFTIDLHQAALKISPMEVSVYHDFSVAIDPILYSFGIMGERHAGLDVLATGQSNLSGRRSKKILSFVWDYW